MADPVVQFDPQALIKELDIFSKVQVPFMASLAINRTTPKVNQALRSEMEKQFTYLAPFTWKSIRYDISSKSKLEVRVWISYDAPKGNAPEDYLSPQIAGGDVYATRFQRRLVRNGLMPSGSYMMPIHASPAATLNASGRIAASQYTQALYGIQAMNDIIARTTPRNKPYATAGSYQYVPFANGDKSKMIFRNGRPLAPGIYKNTGGKLTMLFKQLQRIPTVRGKYDFTGVGMATANEVLPKMFDQVFNEVMGKPNL